MRHAHEVHEVHAEDDLPRDVRPADQVGVGIDVVPLAHAFEVGQGALHGASKTHQLATELTIELAIEELQIPRGLSL